MIKHSKRKYCNDLLRENIKHPAKFWKTIKEIFPTTEKPSISSTTKSSIEKKLRANQFCNFFSSVAANLKRKALPLPDYIWGSSQHPSKDIKTVFAFTHVTTVFVEKELKNLKRKKAAGVDNIPSGMIKDVASMLAKPLSFIINMSLKTTVLFRYYQ